MVEDSRYRIEGNEQAHRGEPQTIEAAQQEITQILADLHTYRRIMDDGNEADDPPYQAARSLLRDLLRDLPAEVASVSVHTSSPRVTQETINDYPGWSGRTLYALQSMLALVDPTTEQRDPIDFEFVARPNYIPTKLRGLTHGSTVRDSAVDVFETLSVDDDRGHSVISIRPEGIPRGVILIGESEIPFNIPLAYVTGITLNREQKPLTPSIYGIDRRDLRVEPVAYKKST